MSVGVCGGLNERSSLTSFIFRRVVVLRSPRGLGEDLHNRSSLQLTGVASIAGSDALCGCLNS